MASDYITVTDFMSAEESSILVRESAATDTFAYPHIWENMPAGSFFRLRKFLCVYDLFSAFGTLNRLLTDNKESLNTYDEPDGFVYHKNWYSIDTIIRIVIDEIWKKLMPGTIKYAGTSIANIKRLYSLEDKNEFVNILKEYFDKKKKLLKLGSKRNTSNSEEYKPLSFLNKWIDKFGIAHHVELRSHAEGFGVSIHLFCSEQDRTGFMLADKGYGTVQIFAILLKIENAIIESSYHCRLNSSYIRGVEHLKDFISSYSTTNPITIALEEPENHMHPSMQSLLASMIVESYKEYNVNFIIETHSEYLIRKIQTLYAEGQVKDSDVRILYVNDASKLSEYEDQVVRIGLNEDGSLDRAFGKGFLDEADSLVSELFNIKLQNNGKA